MTHIPFDLQDFSMADSERLLRQGFAPTDLVSLYHNSTPIVAIDDKRPDSENC